MRYMVIERFREGSREEVYVRFQERGRLLPDGLQYIDSWVERKGNRCFQLMETEDVGLFKTWVGQWKDLVEFEIIPLEEQL